MKFNQCLHCGQYNYNQWIPLDIFMKFTGVSITEIYQKVSKGIWKDGFVVKKQLFQTRKNTLWTHGNISQFYEWQQLNKKLKNKNNDK